MAVVIDQQSEYKLRRLIRGEPCPEERAAFVAVLGSRLGKAGDSRRRFRSDWNHPARLVRTTHDWPRLARFLPTPLTCAVSALGFPASSGGQGA